MTDFAAELLTKAQDFKARLRSQKEKGAAKEKPVDPVTALNTFVGRLEHSNDSRIQRHGELISDHLEGRLREFQEAQKKNPKLTLHEWVGRLTAMQVGDVVKGSGWDLEGLKRSDYNKQPGQFGANWNASEIWKILGEDDQGGFALEERTWKHVPEEVRSFTVGVQGDYGPGSEGRAFASYAERGIKVTKPGETEAGIDVLLQVEVPHKNYGIGYSHDGAILGLGLQIHRNTLEAFLQNKIATAHPIAGATR